jgi:ABC-type transport system involved in cytochrome bd biosynthesis fused ATPase/permease subunit
VVLPEARHEGTTAAPQLIGTPGSALFVVVILALAVIAGTVRSLANGSIAFELRKYVIQLLLIVALGAVVASVAESLKQRREAADHERQYAVDTLTSLLDRLDRIYRAVKWTTSEVPRHRHEGSE